MVWASSDGAGKIFYFFLKQTTLLLGAHKATHSMRSRDTFLGKKWPDYGVDHLPPSGAEVKIVWNYTGVQSTCLLSADGNRYTFLTFFLTIVTVFIP